MRILHIVPGMANASGPTQAVTQLASAQTKLGAHIEVAYVSGRGADFSSSTCHPFPILGFPARTFKHWAYSPSMRSWLDKNVGRFDQVHVHSLWLYPNLAASRSCARIRVPYWIRPAGSLEPWCLSSKSWRKSIYFQVVERGVLNRASAIHAVSAQEHSGISRLGLRPPIVNIPNGVQSQQAVELQRKMNARRALGLDPSAPVLLFLSRIHPKKGMDVLGRAFAKILSMHAKCRLLIVGPIDSEYARDVILDYKSLGLGDSVQFLGALDGEHKTQAYAAADATLLPSHSENFGIVVAESLAAGTPVLASQNTPWHDLEVHGCGFWLPLDADAFAEKACWILDNPSHALDMGRKGQQLVEAKYAWPSIASVMLEAYAETSAAWRCRSQ